MKRNLVVLTVLLFTSSIFGQGLVESDGEIHALSGGIRFPDSTLQTTAAFNEEIFSLTNNPRKCYLVLGEAKDEIRIPLIQIPEFGVERTLSVISGGGGDREFSNPEQIELVLLKESDSNSVLLFQYSVDLIGNGPSKAVIEFTDENDNLFQSWDLGEPGFGKFLLRSVPYKGALINIEEIVINTTQITFYQYGSNASCYCFSFVSNSSCNCISPPAP